MKDVFTRVNQISPKWLTGCLRARGVLPRGRATALAGREQVRLRTVIRSVKVQYSDDAPPTAPRELFLKAGSSDALENEDWLAEVDFYTRLAPASATVVVPCY